MAKHGKKVRSKRPSHAASSVELKNFDGTVLDAVVPATGVILQDSMCLIAQGTTALTRVGRKIVIKKIQMKWINELAGSGTTTSTADTIRLILYQDKQANGAIATTAAILGASPEVKSFRNLDEVGRFRVLMDRVVELKSNYSDSATSGLATVYSSLNMNTNIVLEYSGVAGAITELRSNNVGLMVITDHGLAGLDLNWRLRYVD